MKIATKQATASPAAIDRLTEIQEQMQDICRPHYHEYYKVVTERGFVKITIPKSK